MKTNLLSIDARMLFAGGIGTYEQNLLKRMNFEELGLPVEIYYRTPEEADWLRKYQPKATLRHCPYWIYKPQEQLFWLQNLRGGLFWAPNYNIPWGGYEKLVTTLHDACLCMTKYTSWILNVYSRIMFARIKHKADAAIAVSEFAAQMSVEMGGLKNLPIHVTNLGVEPEWFVKTNAPCPYPFPYFVYVGNIKPHKNLSRLLMAFQKASTKQKLICVGSFKKLKLRDEKAVNLMKSMGDRVMFTDEIRGQALQTIVENADGLLFPSLCEGFGLPPLEAMAAGVPVLSSRISPMKELCGDFPVYCDPLSLDDITAGIQKLAEQKNSDTQAQRQQATQHVKQFVWEKTAKETMEVLKKVLAQ